jgi:hypothetical protein
VGEERSSCLKNESNSIFLFLGNKFARVKKYIQWYKITR